MNAIVRLPNGVYMSPLCTETYFRTEHLARGRHARLMHEDWIRAYAGTKTYADACCALIEAYERMRSETGASKDIDAAPIDVHRSELFSQETGGYFGTTAPTGESTN